MNAPARYPDLKDRVVLITGGANGIGAAMVRAFHLQGAEVHFCDLDANGGGALAEELGGAARFQRVDLGREAEIRRWVGRTVRRGQTIGVLINNAAVDPRLPLEKSTVTFWDRLF